MSGVEDIEMPLSSQGGHSANVTIRLLLNGEDIPVAQMGPDYLFIDAAVDRRLGEPGWSVPEVRLGWGRRTRRHAFMTAQCVAQRRPAWPAYS